MRNCFQRMDGRRWRGKVGLMTGQSVDPIRSEGLAKTTTNETDLQALLEAVQKREREDREGGAS